MNKDGSNPLIIFRPWDSSSVSDISAESLATNHNDRKFLKIESKNFDNQLKNNGHKSCDQIDKNKSTMTIEPLINYPQIPPSIHNYRPRPHPNLFSLFHQESTKCSPLFSGNIKNIVPKMFPGSGTGYEFSEYFFQHCAFNSSNIQRSPVISNMPPPPSSSATSINSLNSFGPNLFGAYLPNIVDNKTNVNNNNPLMASKEMHLDFVKESMIKFMNPSDLNKHQQMGIESASNANFCPTIPGNTNLGKKQRPKRFQCPHCQVSFSNNGQLKGHIRIHTGEFKINLTIKIKV